MYIEAEETKFVVKIRYRFRDRLVDVWPEDVKGRVTDIYIARITICRHILCPPKLSMALSPRFSGHDGYDLRVDR
jgi:hypothetical protein